MSNAKKQQDLNYSSYSKEYGDMFHLILDVEDFKTKGIRFCSLHDKGKYLTLNEYPVFYTHTQGFLVAIDYTIVYPKIYVKTSKAIIDIHGLKRSYIH